MPVIVEHLEEGGILLKYKLDEYYSSYLKTFLTSLASTGLLERCSISTSPNEAYYHLEFSAGSICTLKEFLGSPLSGSYGRGDSFSSSSSYSSLEFSDEEEELDEEENLVQGNDVLFSYNQSLALIGCLSTQLSALRRNKLSFFKLSLYDIFVINRNTFLMFNPDAVLPLKSNRTITFLTPEKIDSSTFCCPEIVRRKIFPFYCPSACIYYSFASLVYYCMFNDYLPSKEEEPGGLKGIKIINGLKELVVSDGVGDRGGDGDADVGEEGDRGDDGGEEGVGFERVNDFDWSDSGSNSSINNEYVLEKDRMISRLKGTKLYFFLKRCLEANGEKRRLFLI